MVILYIYIYIIIAFWEDERGTGYNGKCKKAEVALRRHVPSPRRLLPIAPRANKTFFDRKAKMCVRVVRFQNTKVATEWKRGKGWRGWMGPPCGHHKNAIVKFKC